MILEFSTLAGISLLILSSAIAVAVLILALALARRVKTIVEIEEEVEEGIEPADIALGLERQLAEVRSTQFGPRMHIPPPGTEMRTAPPTRGRLRTKGNDA